MKIGKFSVVSVTVAAIIGITASTFSQVLPSIPLGLNLRGGISVQYKISPGPGQTLSKQGIKAALQAVETRVNSLGVTAPVINLENKDEINVQLAGISNMKSAEKVIGETPKLAVYGQISQNQQGKPVPVKSSLLITGSDIKDNAAVGRNKLGQTVVNVTFKQKENWAAITKQYLGKDIYTFLNGKLIDAAQVKDIIPNGQTSIGPLQSPHQAQTLAKQLNAGALPYPLKLLSSTSIGPKLGAASLADTLYAGGIAVGLIFFFMAVMYRVSGIIADLGLVVYAYLTVLIFAGMPITLTLSGLAALVLGVGMAVDANIITYERIKEEIRNGRSLRSAVISGSRQSLRAVVDSNATTFLVAAVMFWFGHGDIRGFAVALMVSIVVSFVSVVLLTRALMLQFIESRVLQHPKWFGFQSGGADK